MAMATNRGKTGVKHVLTRCGERITFMDTKSYTLLWSRESAALTWSTERLIIHVENDWTSKSQSVRFTVGIQLLFNVFRSDCETQPKALSHVLRDHVSGTSTHCHWAHRTHIDSSWPYSLLCMHHSQEPINATKWLHASTRHWRIERKYGSQKQLPPQRRYFNGMTFIHVPCLCPSGCLSAMLDCCA